MRGAGRSAGLGGLITWVAVAALAACSPADDGAPVDTDPVPTVAAAPATSPVTPSPLATTTAAVESTVVLDATAALGSAIDALASGYHFTTTVSIDGEVAITAEGDRVGDGTRLTVAGPGGTVAYVITPIGTWVRPEDGEWEALDTPPANSDPIGALRSPTAVTVDSADAALVRLTATVPATALGIPGPADSMAAVQLSLAAGALTGMTYSSSVDGRTASVDAVVSPLVDTTPVVAPI